MEKHAHLDCLGVLYNSRSSLATLKEEYSGADLEERLAKRRIAVVWLPTGKGSINVLYNETTAGGGWRTYKHLGLLILSEAEGKLGQSDKLSEGPKYGAPFVRQRAFS